MTGLFLAMYILALDSNSVLIKQCIENAGTVTFQDGYDTMKGLPNMTCNKHPGAYSVTCVNPTAQTVGRVILVKDKNECNSHPERELHNLKVMLKRDFK